MKLPNGYGSVTKLTGNRRRPYMVRITTGFTDEGRQLMKILGYYAKRTEALNALAEYNQSPYDVESVGLTFSQVHERWEAATYVDGKEQSNQYKAAYKRCAPLWDIPFKDIKTAQFQQVINDCDKGYATKKAIRIVCNLMAKYALANDIIVKNYVELTSLPPQVESRIHNPLTKKELAILWENSKDIKVQAVLILCYTGMRPTELVKVEKANVDFENKFFVGGMKTAAGRGRRIPIADKIFDFFKDACERSTGEYIFSDERGKNISYDAYRSRYWEPVMNMFKMDHLPGDGRHTCASLLDDKDVNVKIKKLILGHASSDVTERVYTHKTLEQLLEAINLIQFVTYVLHTQLIFRELWTLFENNGNKEKARSLHGYELFLRFVID